MMHVVSPIEYELENVEVYVSQHHIHLKYITTSRIQHIERLRVVFHISHNNHLRQQQRPYVYETMMVVVLVLMMLEWIPSQLGRTVHEVQVLGLE
jgi:hypothetical protein